MQQNTPSSKDSTARFAESQKWITPEAEQSAQRSIRAAFEVMGPAGHKLRSALHGDWLNEPIHAILTDIPVGAWTAAAVFDLLGALLKSETADIAADASIAVGLLGALGAAIRFLYFTSKPGPADALLSQAV